jgi:DNA-directed RNA polymerase specialized sigma24 family protein
MFMSSHPANGLPGEAFRRIFQHLSDRRASFLTFVRKRVDSVEKAEDLLQSAYLRALEHLPELRDEGRADAWFYRLLRNAIIDHYRRTAAAARVFVEDAPLHGPAEPILRPNTCPCATRELGHLNPNYSHALEDVEMYGMPVQIFASNEKIAPGTASVRLHRARKALAWRLHTVCGSCAGAGCFDCTCASSAP